MKIKTMDKERNTRPTVDEMFAAYERQQEAVEELAARIESRGGLRLRRYTRRQRRMVTNIVLSVVSLAAFGGCLVGLAAFGGDGIDRMSFVLAAVVSAVCFVACTVLAVRNRRIRLLPMAEVYRRVERQEALDMVIHRLSVTGVAMALFLLVMPVYASRSYYGQHDRTSEVEKIDCMFKTRMI